MDGHDANYVGLILDPRFKTLLLEKELGGLTAPKVIKHIKELLREQYPLVREQSMTPNDNDITHTQSIEVRLLQKLQPQRQRLSDIDRYFEDVMVTVDESVTMEKN
jgi:hypothetical protein